MTLQIAHLLSDSPAMQDFQVHRMNGVSEDKQGQEAVTEPAGTGAHPPVAGRNRRGVIRAVLAWFLEQYDRRAQAHALDCLSDRELSDIGISRIDARREARRLRRKFL